MLSKSIILVTILAIYEKNGLEIVQLKMVRLTNSEAKAFYEIHKDRPFYNDLVNFVTSGPVVAMTLKGENAVAKARELIGATDPKKAAPGTIRALYATDVGVNAIHGSDSPENAEKHTFSSLLTKSLLLCGDKRHRISK